MLKPVCFILIIFVSAAAFGSEDYWDPHDIKYRYAKNHVFDFDGLIFGQCLQQEIRKFRSSSQIKHDYPVNPLMSGENMQCELTNQSLMTYLTAEKDRCDFQTGNEQKLKQIILLQKDNSVDPVMLFRASLKLNGGRIFDAVLTIHQLLRNEARWWNDSVYAYRSSPAKSSVFWNKFIDIRGDLDSRKNGFHGDHAGSWYRIWGTMLYSMKVNQGLGKGTCAEAIKGMNAIYGQFQAVGAELVKYLMDVLPGDYTPGGDRRGKMLINTASAEAAQMLEPGRATLPWFNQSYCSERKYLVKSAFDY